MQRFHLFWLIGLIATLSFTACSDDDDDEVKIPATVEEIQGTWLNSSNGVIRQYTFSGNDYILLFTSTDVSDSKIKREMGTFVLNGTTMTTIMTSGTDLTCGELEVYWTSSLKNVLHIWPMGDFYKSSK